MWSTRWRCRYITQVSFTIGISVKEVTRTLAGLAVKRFYMLFIIGTYSHGVSCYCKGGGVNFLLLLFLFRSRFFWKKTKQNTNKTTTKNIVVLYLSFFFDFFCLFCLGRDFFSQKQKKTWTPPLL